MTTREEIEAACEIVRKYKTMRSKYPLPETLPRFVDHARAVLADAYLIERAERQRRIAALTHALFGHHSMTHDELREIITRHLVGDTT